MWFLCLAQPSGPLVKRGCFIGRPHPWVSFIKNSVPPVGSLPTNQCCSHIIPQAPCSSTCPSFLFYRGLPPHHLLFPCWYSGETSEWQWKTSWGREARREKCAPVLLSCISLWKEILPWHKGSSIFCVRKHLRPFLSVVVPAPLAWSHPCCAFLRGSHLFHCFPPLLLICPRIYFKRLPQPERKCSKMIKRSVSTTLPKVSCQKQTCLLCLL